MKVIIHDLGEEYDAFFREQCDVVVNADGRYAPCQGCFGCWTKHPAECFMKDSLKEICRVIGKADELILITENFYGGYSPAVKNILDRSIGSSTPFSTYRDRQMHHTLRYGKHKLLRIYTYGDINAEERATWELMAKRNAVNYGYEDEELVVLKGLEELESTAL